MTLFSSFVASQRLPDSSSSSTSSCLVSTRPYSIYPTTHVHMCLQMCPAVTCPTIPARGEVGQTLGIAAVPRGRAHIPRALPGVARPSGNEGAGGQAQRTANAARYVVRASSYPRNRFSSGFYPILALSIFPWCYAFWLPENVRAWRRRFDGQEKDSCDGVNSIFIKNENDVNTIKLIVLLAIEAPVACLYILMMSAKFPMVKKDDTEASRTIAGALTRHGTWPLEPENHQK